MTTRSTTARRLPAVAALTLALCAGCASGDDTEQRPAKSKSSASAPHGYVEGAEESAEQQSRLVLGDPTTGKTRVLDLIDEKTHKTPAVKKPTALTTDGRFAHFHTATGATLLDTGAWMVDHGDHVHYYRADIRPMGRIPADRGLAIRSDAAVTAVTAEGGGTRLHRRADLEDGRIGKGRDAGIEKPASVIPFDEHLVVVSDDGGNGRITVRTRAGKQVAAPKTDCRDPRGDAVTRRGVVLSCADGAVLVREEDGTFEAVEIPYPEGTPEGERADDFRLRPGSDTLTSPAGDEAVWVLDVTDRKWKRIDTGPVVAANTAGEGAPLLALSPDGTLRGYDIDSGRRTAETELGAEATGKGKGKSAGAPGAPDITVDTTRAYVSDPAGKSVAEIDYNDDLRLARTFDLDITPGLMVETGR